VVGGGDSAIEAALALSGQPGNTVQLSYRGDKFARLKPVNRERMEQATKAGRVEILWKTTLTDIGPTEVRYRDEALGIEVAVPNDYVFVFAGGELPTAFLQACGVAIDTKFGAPR